MNKSYIISTLSINDSILVSSSRTGKFVQEKNYADSEIKENYGIQYLLRGDVQSAEGAYGVSLQMTDLKKIEVVWSKLFDLKELKELFPVQEKNKYIHFGADETLDKRITVTPEKSFH